VDFAVTLQRAVGRDLELFGLIAPVEERYMRRYIPGQRLYVAEAWPHKRADIIVKYDDPDRPALIGSP
jgi:uridine kinase